MTTRIKTSDTEMIEVNTFKNEKGKFLNVRKFWRSKGGTKDDWKPGRQGISLSEEKAKKIIKAMKVELEDIENAQELPEREGKDSKKNTKKDKDTDND